MRWRCITAFCRRRSTTGTPTRSATWTTCRTTRAAVELEIALSNAMGLGGHNGCVLARPRRLGSIFSSYGAICAADVPGRGNKRNLRLEEGVLNADPLSRMSGMRDTPDREQRLRRRRRSSCARGRGPRRDRSRHRSLRRVRSRLRGHPRARAAGWTCATSQEEHLDGFDAVVHLAALSNDPIGELDENLTYAINHEASVRLAELARARGVERFVFASSCSMYGAVRIERTHRRDRPAGSADRVRRVEGADASGIWRGWPSDDFSPVVAPLRHRLRRLSAASARHRAEQPRRMGSRRRVRCGCRATAPPGGR